MSALKRILDEYDMGIFEFMKEVGMLKSITKYKKIYDDPNSTVSDIEMDVLLAICYKFGVSLDELLDKYDKNGINYRINVAKNHGELIKKRIERMKKGTVTPIENVDYVIGDNSVRLTYKDAKLEAARKMTMVDNGQEVANLLEAKNSPVRTGDAQDGTLDALGELDTLDTLDDLDDEFDESKNIAVRADDVEIDDLTYFQENDTLFHNKEEANRIFKRLRRYKAAYRKDPSKLSNKQKVLPRYNLSPIPNSYASLCPCYVEYYEGNGSGILDVMVSVFNKRNEFLFSEAYRLEFVEDGDYKGIKYYKKVFYDLLSDGLELEFTKDDEISEADYFHGLYRQYRIFGFQV